MHAENVYEGAIGIDLGTTYSCVGVWANDRVEIIANEQGNNTTPSYVAFTDEERLIGEAAKNQVAMNPEHTVYDAKRLLGRAFDDHSVKRDVEHFPFHVFERSGKPYIRVQHKGETKEYSPEEISAMVLLKMKEIAEHHLGKTVTKAVITVPAYFNDAQRQSTKDAGRIAGLEVLRIINEPTAAAIAYGLDNAKEGVSNVLIFDLGGGTFDVSLLSIDKGVFTVRATAGDTHLGGEDFDNNMVNFFTEEFKRKHKIDIKKDMRAVRRLRTACERAKRTLSSLTNATIEIDALADGVDFYTSITRAKFEELNNAQFLSTMEPVKKVLKDAGIDKKKVNEIVLVGGSTRIPKIQSLLQTFFDGKQLNRKINPDEAVAQGAAVQGAVLCNVKGKLEDLLLMDVTPLSLGIEMEGGVMAVVVPRNCPIPALKKKTFTTVQDNQTNVVFPVYEGERTMTKDNNLLGQFDLHGITAAPRGVAQLECTFELDANGMLKVTAEDKSSGKIANIVISNTEGRLSASDVQRMIEDAKKNKDEDKKLAQANEARQTLDGEIRKLQAKLEEKVFALRARPEDIQKLEEAIGGALEFLDSNPDATKSQLDEKYKNLAAVGNIVRHRFESKNKTARAA